MFDGLAPPGLRTSLPYRLEVDRLDRINRNLLGWWPLNEAGGSVARDLSPYRRHGVLENAPSRLTMPRGWAASFPGGGAGAPNINLGAPAHFNALQVPLTISAWVKPTYSSGNRTVFAQYESFSAPGGMPKMLRLEGFNLVYYGTDAGGGLYQFVSAAGVIAQDIWCHVAAVVSGGLSAPRVALYVNGKQVASASFAAMNASPNTAAVSRIGTSTLALNYPAAEGFVGPIQDVRLFGRAAPDDDIRRLAREPWAGAVAPEDRLLVFWRAPVGGTVYNESLTDTATAGDSGANAFTARNAGTDTATAGDSGANAFTARNAGTDTATAGDSGANAFTARNAGTDSATAGDSGANAFTARNAGTDSAAAGESGATALTAREAVTDAAAATDAASAGSTSYSDATTDSATAGDGVTVSAIFTLSTVETTAAGDSGANAFTARNAATDSAAAGESGTTALTARNALTDSATASDQMYIPSALPTSPARVVGLPARSRLVVLADRVPAVELPARRRIVILPQER
jgi:hypothetical protein